jgi:UDP-N-acetylmuramoylalanine--D-glutamate ligase
VTVTDLKTQEELQSSYDKLKHLPITWKLGGHENDDFINADIILRNADVPRKVPFLKVAADNNVRVEMDESWFMQLAPEVTIVGITGTRGKTSTTKLIYHILKQTITDRGVFLAGNIQGKATLPLLGQVKAGDIVVLELSSWQLQGFEDAGISPHISVFTNMSPDHLNRYESMERYISDKKNIYRFQGDNDICFFNKNDELVASFLSEAPARAEYFDGTEILPEQMGYLRGEHSKSNIAAALKVIEHLGVDKEAGLNAIKSFKGVEHRLEYVDTVNGVQFYNDTASTAPVATLCAVNSFHEPIILLAGGSDKGIPFDELLESCRKPHVKNVLLLKGKGTDRFLSEFDISEVLGERYLGVYDNFTQAMKDAVSQAEAGDVVLLSPGCASFGLFKNAYDRGDQFIDFVKSL